MNSKHKTTILAIILIALFVAVVLTWTNHILTLTASNESDIIVPLTTPQPTVEEPLEYPIYSIEQSGLKKELRQFTGCDKHYLDEIYYYTDYANASILLTSIEMPEFIPETWDCDDMAWYLKSEMARLYGLNCVGYAEGDHVGFDHAWNIVLTTEGVFTWEAELQEWNNESWYDASLIWF